MNETSKTAATAPAKLFMDGTKLNRHLETVVKWQKGEWFAPIHMEVSLTNVCNQKCTFCYTAWAHGKVMMDEETVVRMMRSAKDAGVKSTLIAGEGEPTANPAYVRAIETCGEVGLDCALNTNAVNLTDDALYRILPHLQWVRFSVQGSTKERYAAIHKVPDHHFDKAMRNIRRAAEIKKELGLGVTLGVQQVLIEENGADALNVAKLAKDLGVDYYVIKPCHPHEKTTFKSISLLVEKYRDTLEAAAALSDDNFRAIVRWNFLAEAEARRSYDRCMGLPFIIQILSDGVVSTCYPMADKKAFHYGNLHDMELIDILKSDQFAKTCKWVEENVDVHQCMPTCRQHNVNKYLWWLEEEKPDHFNFI
ncbi:MAG: radical SAM protein [Alphaproteobacteria bacterium]|nr:radical SAM protein [Alphaproteobacteria bacterium]MBF0249265.1 radical SAM protein [Alphaproteobacteria bacterium]